VYGIIDHLDSEMIIYLDYEQPQEQKFISILHEFYHLYFRDYSSTTNKDYINDEVERRAEISSLNMLAWYHKNPKFFKKFINKALNINVENITPYEHESLKEIL
jgi:hypothetical protein